LFGNILSRRVAIYKDTTKSDANMKSTPKEFFFKKNTLGSTGKAT